MPHFSTLLKQERLHWCNRSLNQVWEAPSREIGNIRQLGVRLTLVWVWHVLIYRYGDESLHSCRSECTCLKAYGPLVQLLYWEQGCLGIVLCGKTAEELILGISEPARTITDACEILRLPFSILSCGHKDGVPGSVSLPSASALIL